MFSSSSPRLSRPMLVAVALFLLFDFAALGLNVWMSVKIEREAVGINLAGRQRMLSQRMAKVLLELEDAQRAGTSTATPLQELALTTELFDQTLQGFWVGRDTESGQGGRVFLSPVADDHARHLVAQALEIWKPYRELSRAVLVADAKQLPERLPPVVAYAKAHNLELLSLMNELTTELEVLTRREASRMRWYQGITFALALLNFVGVFALYQRRIERAHQLQDLLDEVMNKVAACVMVLDEDGKTVLKANHMAERLFGREPGELIGQQIGQLVIQHDEGAMGVRADGSMFPVLAERHVTYQNGRRLFVETVSDVTEQRRNEAHLMGLAFHDALTQLPNRQLFDDRLQMEIARARRHAHQIAVLFVDLDRFKAINDLHGHDMGDSLLKKVANRLRACLRESDTVSRRGGDEFTVILSEVSGPEAAAHVAQQIIEQMHTPFTIRGEVLKIGASVGICMFPSEAHDMSSLVNGADEAMYRAKMQGRGAYCFHARNDD